MSYTFMLKVETSEQHKAQSLGYCWSLGVLGCRQVCGLLGLSAHRDRELGGSSSPLTASDTAAIIQHHR